MKFQYVHGNKLVNDIIKEELTAAELGDNVDKFIPSSTKRQHSTQPIQIAQIKYIPAPESNNLRLTSVARNFISSKKYDTTISFNDIEYEPEDTPQNITFIASDNEKYHIQPIILRTKTCKVSCNCLDFYFRFANWNFNTDSLDGKKPPTYYPKTHNRPPVNPENKPGMCKHIIKLIQVLKAARLIKY